MSELVLEVKAKRYTATNFSFTSSKIIQEKRIAIYLNGRKLLSVIALPQDSDAHVVGFLMSEGVIEKLSDILSIYVSLDNELIDIQAKIVEKNLKNLFHEKTLTSGCCVGVTGNDGSMSKFIATNFYFKASTIFEKLQNFEDNCQLFTLTGCVHKAMLIYFSPKGLKELACEDIGRHNAIDKVLGRSLLKGLDVSRSALIVSGRLSQEMVVKAAMSNIPVVISRAASTYLGIKTANELGITLIGFARDKSMLVYTHDFRIKA